MSVSPPSPSASLVSTVAGTGLVAAELLNASSESHHPRRQHGHRHSHTASHHDTRRKHHRPHHGDAAGECASDACQGSCNGKHRDLPSHRTGKKLAADPEHGKLTTALFGTGPSGSGPPLRREQPLTSPPSSSNPDASVTAQRRKRLQRASSGSAFGGSTRRRSLPTPPSSPSSPTHTSNRTLPTGNHHAAAVPLPHVAITESPESTASHSRGQPDKQHNPTRHAMSETLTSSAAAAASSSPSPSSSSSSSSSSATLHRRRSLPTPPTSPSRPGVQRHPPAPQQEQRHDKGTQQQQLLSQQQPPKQQAHPPAQHPPAQHPPTQQQPSAQNPTKHPPTQQQPSAQTPTQPQQATTGGTPSSAPRASDLTEQPAPAAETQTVSSLSRSHHQGHGAPGTSDPTQCSADQGRRTKTLPASRSARRALLKRAAPLVEAADSSMGQRLGGFAGQTPPPWLRERRRTSPALFSLAVPNDGLVGRSESSPPIPVMSRLETATLTRTSSAPEIIVPSLVLFAPDSTVEEPVAVPCGPSASCDVCRDGDDCGCSATHWKPLAVAPRSDGGNDATSLSVWDSAGNDDSGDDSGDDSSSSDADDLGTVSDASDSAWLGKLGADKKCKRQKQLARELLQWQRSQREEQQRQDEEGGVARRGRAHKRKTRRRRRRSSPPPLETRQQALAREARVSRCVKLFADAALVLNTRQQVLCDFLSEQLNVSLSAFATQQLVDNGVTPEVLQTSMCLDDLVDLNLPPSELAKLAPLVA